MAVTLKSSQRSAIIFNSFSLNIFPVGLFGVLIMMTFVFELKIDFYSSSLIVNFICFNSMYLGLPCEIIVSGK